MSYRERALKGLNGSEKHWVRLATDTTRSGEWIGIRDCDLCNQFHNSFPDLRARLNVCGNCPLSLYSGKEKCSYEEYHEASVAMSVNGKHSTIFHAAARDMVTHIRRVRNWIYNHTDSRMEEWEIVALFKRRHENV